MTFAAPLPLLLLSCARMEPPPGGPPDASPPQLIATVPESLASYDGLGGPVEFIFDEVVSEGGGAGQGGRSDLDRLVILSPTRESPKVEWRRSRITVEPEEGWQPNTVYRAQLLPGITDLRNNRSAEGTVLTFTTGAPLPTTTLTGQVVDWTSGRPAAAALVEALLLPDSLRYRVLADSSGDFALGPLPAGEYIVSGVLDENRNLRADAREAFDSARAAPGDTTVGELWTFVHDTTAPRSAGVTVGDSVSGAIELAQPLDPRLRLEPRNASVWVLPDSTPVAVVSVLPKPLDDSLNARRPEKPDTAAADSAARDTTAADTGRQGRPAVNAPLTTRPPLSNRLVVRVREAWKPGGRYGIEIRGVRNVSGTTGVVRGALVVPEPVARDSVARDSVARDSVSRDSLPPEEE
ncbi:MAG: Ig-like domain-containing protein [Gemmatimonadales bacterium]|nr:Ig-like domain-containing protein [Gemmatimonadales bacterium]